MNRARIRASVGETCEVNSSCSRPRRNVSGLRWIVKASQFDTLLYFSRRDLREISLTETQAFQPSEGGAMGFLLAHLRYDIGVNQITNQSNSGGLGVPPVPPLAIGISNRGPSPSKTPDRFLASPAFDFCRSST